jgi:uncharacterized membrane protein YsdA (DUF1294 family)
VEFEKKSIMNEVILFYFLFINVLSMFIYAVDKWLAKKSYQRISERELHTFVLLGGFLGATLSMAIFGHKTSKSSFLIKHIILMTIWIAVISYYIINKF